MPPRLYAPDAHATGDVVALPSTEGEHAARVLRLAAGDPLRVFNGRGGEFDAAVTMIGKSRVLVQLGAARDPAPEATVAVTLVQAVLKGDKMDGVVRDAVMLGAAAIQPLVSTRVEMSLGALARGHRRQRWERVAVASAKQCGRATVPPVRDPVDVDDLVVSLGRAALPGPVLLLVEPSAAAHATRLSDLEADVPAGVTLVVGPEGGWADRDLERLLPAARPVSLGGRTLRADAIAVVALAALCARWGEF